MYQIGEVARLSGVHIETIRFYEREQVLPVAERTASGRRIYDADALARIKFIKRCRDLGFSMADGRTLLVLACKGGMSCGEAKPIAQTHLVSIEAKLKALKQLHNSLQQLLNQCGGPDDACPVLLGLLGD